MTERLQSDGAATSAEPRLARERLDEELREAGMTAGDIVETIHDPLVVLSPDLRVRVVNPAFYEHFKVEPEETTGRLIYELGNGQWDIPELHTLLEEILPERKSFDGYEVSHEFTDLGWRVMRLNARRLDHMQRVLLVIADVTDEKQVEAFRQSAKESREAADHIRLQADMLAAVGEAVIATNLAGIITYWNPAAEALYGWSREEALSRPVLEVTPAVGERDAMVEVFATLKAGGTWTGELDVRRRDGSTFRARVTDAPILDGDGHLIGIIGVSSDITEQRHLEGQLRQAQKMEAIGRLAGGVAHDFNNLLTAVEGHAGMLLDDLPADSPFREDVVQIQKAGERAADLTRQLLAFSRRQVLETRNVDLCSVAVELEKLVRRLVPERIRFRVAVSAEPAVVRADPGQLHQVIMNLVVNAVDAIEQGGSITVGVQPVELDEGDTREMAWDVEPGSYVRLCVQDTGSGMTPAVAKLVFEPFFTTKPEGQGTGLGLATVYGIVKQSEGHIVVDSEPGRGTTFSVFLPRAGAEADPIRERPATVSAVVGGVVLLVEDDDAVRSIGRKILARAGFTVVEAANGRDALNLVDDGIDVVISDVVMPDMGGPELRKRLAEHYPDLKVIFTSGYSEAEVMSEVRQFGTAFLPKPFTPQTLVRCVTDVLAAPGKATDTPAVAQLSPIQLEGNGKREMG